jgi:tetratricopeptide (TPR) repeat protein
MHLKNGNPEAALAQLVLALEVYPGHGELRSEVFKQGGDHFKLTTPGLARLYMRGGLFDLAATEFRAALLAEPKRLDLMVGLAEAEWYAGHGTNAALLSQQILDESPDCLKALLIAACVAASGDQPLAVAEEKLWEQVHALDPENVRIQDMFTNADIVLSPDRWAIIQKADEVPDLKDASPLSERASASPSQHDLPDRLPIPSGAASLPQPAASPHTAVADIAPRKPTENDRSIASRTDRSTLPPSSDAEPTIGQLINALGLNPADNAARLGLARGYQQLEQVDAALEQYRTLLGSASGLGPETVDALQEFLRLHPDNPEIHRALGDAYKQTGRFQQAIEEYTRARNLEKGTQQSNGAGLQPG